MQALFSENFDQLKKNLEKLNQEIEIKSALILMSFDGHYKSEALNPLLKEFIKPIMGGVFPELIVDGQRKSKGVLLIPLSFSFKPCRIDYNTDTIDYLTELDEIYGQAGGKLVFVFTDALGKKKNELIESLFNFFGLTLSYLGGGAGSLEFNPFPCIIDNDGIHQNACVIGLSDQPVGVGVAHGWETISEPLKVTDSWDNQLKQINWEPAFHIYKEIVEKHSKKKFTADNFFDIAKSYPLGLVKIDDELIIRDPFMVEGTTIFTVDRINQDEYLSIMHGNLNSLLSAAKNAKEQAESNLKKKSDNMFVIDCISRVLFMQDDFSKELEILKQDNDTVNGALTIGEIANSGSSFLEIFNKTIVVAKW